MKPLLLFGLLLLANITLAQTPVRTKFYILRTGLIGASLRTTLNIDKPISIRNYSYVLIETDADSLGLVVGEETKPFPFDKGKTYYLTLHIDRDRNYTIREVSERDFWLTASLSNIRRSKNYFLSKNGTVQEQ